MSPSEKDKGAFLFLFFIFCCSAIAEHKKNNEPILANKLSARLPRQGVCNSDTGA